MSKFAITGYCCLLMLVTSTVQADKKNPNNDLRFDGAQAKTFKVTDEGSLKLHIFEPEVRTEEPRPVIVFFYGGAWKAGSPKQFEEHCHYLASRGMVAITADYRVSSRQGTKADASVADAKSAIRWVRENYKTLHIDEDRVVAAGGSAGGHLAACTAIIDGFESDQQNLVISSKPNAMVLFNPAVTLAPFNSQQPLPKEKLEQDGGLEFRMGTKPINLSPGHHVVSDLPPTIMFFGTEDFLLDGSKYFHQQMLKAGNRCDLELYDGQSHGFFNYGKSENKYFIETLQATDDFLQSIGYLDGFGNVAAWHADRQR
ncbi:alpha/beta hydrolase [Planctomicrobium sp.]|nr:alpha/beta hydrolase [Planctomicrobium sp.]